MRVGVKGRRGGRLGRGEHGPGEANVIKLVHIQPGLDFAYRQVIETPQIRRCINGSLDTLHSWICALGIVISPQGDWATGVLMLNKKIYQSDICCPRVAGLSRTLGSGSVQVLSKRHSADDSRMVV